MDENGNSVPTGDGAQAGGNQEGAQGDKGNGQEVLSDIKALLESSIASNRVLQGQVHRTEQQVAALQRLVLESKREPAQTDGDPDAALFDGLDQEDPAIKAVIRAHKLQTKRLATLEARVQVTGVTNQEQAERNYTVAELEKVADLADIPITDSLRREISALPTMEMWAEGKRLLAESKRAGASKGASEDKIRQKVIKDLQAQGLLPELQDEREGLLTSPESLEAIDSLNVRFNRGEIDVDEMRKQTTALKRGGRIK